MGQGHDGHFPQGKCGLKSGQRTEHVRGLGHFPQGKCGLKSLHLPDGSIPGRSLPAREVWIEINTSRQRSDGERGHFPQGKCGLKFRTAWPARIGPRVTSRKGSVD